MTTGSHIHVRVTRRFSAAAERVFDAWLDSELLGRWMFGRALRDEEVLHLTLEPSVGGTFSFLVRRQGQEIDHVGTYLELERPRRLVFTWVIAPNPEDQSRVVIEIVPLEKGCELTLTHELHPDWVDYAARTEASWAKMLDTLAAALGVSAPGGTR